MCFTISYTSMFKWYSLIKKQHLVEAVIDNF